MASKSKKRNKKENAVYAASRALWESQRKPTRRIGTLTRIIHYFGQRKKLKAEMNKQYWMIAERRRAKYKEAFAVTCAPIHDAWVELWDTAYNFLLKLFRDFRDLIIDIANIFIVIGYHIYSVILYISDWIADIAYWAEGRRKALLTAFVTMTVLGVAGSIFWTSITAYEYSYYGTTLGVANSKKDVNDTIKILGDKLAESTGTNASINFARDIEFKPVHGFGINTDSPDDILNTLTYMKDLQVDAFAICVDDVQKVVVEDEATARSILDKIKNDFAGEREGVEYTDIHFNQDVAIKAANVKLGDLWNTDDAEKYLKTGSIKDFTHIVQGKESVEDIIATYGVTIEQLQQANPEVDFTYLEEGMEIALFEKNPVIILASTETATFLEDIQFGKQYIDNAALYQGEEETRTPGIYGKNQIVATISRVNGEEISREIISTTKISDPVDAVVYRGTKAIPAKIGTGTFALPIRNYYVSSHVGIRWGRMHEGIDCAAATGTKIYAADGGVVTFSGWTAGLGYCVKIDHGGLMSTVYGHCSRLLVSAGEQVYQGQNIALVGNTGNSTGPHLHLEIRYNGEMQNPEDYLDF